MYDAIVIGARCAGSPAAMLLARSGYRVLLVDRASFPSDAPRNHFIKPSGVACLKRWGLLDRIIASNCPPVTTWNLDFGPLVLFGSPPPIDGVAHSIAPRRRVLDNILVDGAVESGVDLRDNFIVEELLTDDGRVTGIRGRDRVGTSVIEESTIVIGADGLHSVVARAVRAPTYAEKPALTCWYYAYWSDVPIGGVEIYSRPGRAAIAFPTNDGLVCIATVWPNREFNTYRADIAGNFLKTLDLAPGLAERARGGKRQERFIGTADVPNLFRRPFGPGWALVGDAGFHKDPFLAQGISDAFRDAERLTGAVDAGFSGREPLGEALAHYERQRNEAAMPGYEFNAQLAALEPSPPELQQLLAAIQGNQEQINRFIGTIADTLPSPESFAPENSGRVTGTATTSPV